MDSYQRLYFVDHLQMSPPLLCCPEIRRRALFLEFLSQPGAMERLQGQLTEIKRVKEIVS